MNQFTTIYSIPCILVVHQKKKKSCVCGECLPECRELSCPSGGRSNGLTILWNVTTVSVDNLMRETMRE